jgi:hypothetical protein
MGPRLASTSAAAASDPNSENQPSGVPLSGIDHEACDGIDQAARWLAARCNRAPRPHTRAVRERFGMSFMDSVRTIVGAKRLRAGGKEGGSP